MAPASTGDERGLERCCAPGRAGEKTTGTVKRGGCKGAGRAASRRSINDGLVFVEPPFLPVGAGGGRSQKGSESRATQPRRQPGLCAGLTAATNVPGGRDVSLPEVAGLAREGCGRRMRVCRRAGRGEAGLFESRGEDVASQSRARCGFPPPSSWSLSRNGRQSRQDEAGCRLRCRRIAGQLTIAPSGRQGCWWCWRRRCCRRRSRARAAAGRRGAGGGADAGAGGAGAGAMGMAVGSRRVESVGRESFVVPRPRRLAACETREARGREGAETASLSEGPDACAAHTVIHSSEDGRGCIRGEGEEGIERRRRRAGG